MPEALHVVAHTRHGWREVVEPHSAAWLWAALRRWSPRALAVALMPNHLHVAVDADADPSGLDRVLQHHARNFGARWDKAVVQPCNTVQILARAIRYVLLNPLREGLVEDPLAYPWTTLRDLVGTIADPWVDLRALARRLQMSPARLLPYLAGEPWQPPAESLANVVAPLERIADAVLATLRTTPDQLRRRGPARALLVALAYDTGHPRLSDLARLADVTPRSLPDLCRRADPAALTAARRCLRDPRAHRWRL